MDYRLSAAAAASIIFSPLSRPREVCVLTAGYVMAFTYDTEGRRRIHLIYGPGSYFPVLTTFSDKEQRATYEALTDIKAHVFSKAVFLQKIEDDHLFTKDILRCTVDQLNTFANRVVELQSARLEDRLLSRLLALSIDHGETLKAGGTRLPYKLKHHHLADMLGVERESVSRALQRLRQKQVLSLSSDGVIVINGDHNH